MQLHQIYRSKINLMAWKFGRVKSQSWAALCQRQGLMLDSCSSCRRCSSSENATDVSARARLFGKYRLSLFSIWAMWRIWADFSARKKVVVGLLLPLLFPPLLSCSLTFPLFLSSSPSLFFPPLSLLFPFFPPLPLLFPFLPAPLPFPSLPSLPLPFSYPNNDMSL